MSKVNCAAVEKRRQASLRMARAELLLFLTFAHYIAEIACWISSDITVSPSVCAEISCVLAATVEI